MSESVSSPNPGSRRRFCPSGNLGFRKLVEAKRSGAAPLEPALIRAGFRGWHERGFLPHFDAPNVTQFVTFMLADSFPVERRAEWEPLLEEADESLRRRKLEAWLDRGMGGCWLRRPGVGALVEQGLRQFDGLHYRMQAWVIMPNHVHLVVDVFDAPLSQLVRRWKGATAREANRWLGRRGAFWQEDYFDVLIRDAAHRSRATRYTEQNPTKARLAGTARDWPWSSARYRDEYNRLPRQSDSPGHGQHSGRRSSG